MGLLDGLLVWERGSLRHLGLQLRGKARCACSRFRALRRRLRLHVAFSAWEIPWRKAVTQRRELAAESFWFRTSRTTITELSFPGMFTSLKMKATIICTGIDVMLLSYSKRECSGNHSNSDDH